MKAASNSADTACNPLNTAIKRKVIEKREGADDPKVMAARKGMSSSHHPVWVAQKPNRVRTSEVLPDKGLEEVFNVYTVLLTGIAPQIVHRK